MKNRRRLFLEAFSAPFFSHRRKNLSRKDTQTPAASPGRSGRPKFFYTFATDQDADVHLVAAHATGRPEKNYTFTAGTPVGPLARSRPPAVVQGSPEKKLHLTADHDRTFSTPLTTTAGAAPYFSRHRRKSSIPNIFYTFTIRQAEN